MAVVHFSDQAIALDQLEARGARAAGSLGTRGIDPGFVIALLLRNDPAFVEALTCLRCLGGIRVLIPWHLAPREIARILALVAPRLLIVHADLLPCLRDVLAELRDLQIAVVDPHPQLVRLYNLPPADPAALPPRANAWEALIANSPGTLPVPAGAPQAISLTSGSTGAPKVVRWQGPQRWDQWYPARTAGRPLIHTSIVTAPLYHGAQYGVFSQAWRLRANQVILPKFDAEEFLAAVERHRVNHAYMVPTQFTRLLKLPRRVRERYDVSSLNYVFHTGAPCAAAVKHAMIEWLGPVLWEAYGCSETSTVSVCTSAEWLARPGTVGRPVRRVVIVDDHHRPCPPGMTGRIGIDMSAMPPIADSSADTPYFQLDGTRFIPSGDVGTLDADGYLYIAGRADDLINTGRVKVFPAEIEAVLLQHPRVLDCCVFGIRDEEFGQVIGAAVELAEVHAEMEAELRAFLRTRISEHKIPVRIWRETAHLRLDSGKLNRDQIRRRLLGTHAPAESAWRPVGATAG